VRVSDLRGGDMMTVNNSREGSHKGGVNDSREGVHGKGVSESEEGGQGARMSDSGEESHRVWVSDLGKGCDRAGEEGRGLNEWPLAATKHAWQETKLNHEIR
jgi:hypothetical protein